MTPVPTLIYRIFDICNLPGILEEGTIYCWNRLVETGRSCTSIAHDSIMDRRRETIIPCGPGGNLLDYVAFYFAPRSPMLYSIKMGNVAGYEGGQEKIIYIVLTAQKIKEAGIRFVFTDGHGIMALTEFSDDLADLGMIDWGLMRARWWYDTDEDPDRLRRRQAEFLVFKEVSWGLVDTVVVMSEAMKGEVESYLHDFGKSTPVQVKRDWYY